MIAMLVTAPIARADDDPVSVARRRFIEGTDLVAKAQWADALAAFSDSAALHPHPTTTYNIGACERALGRYTRARRSLERALSERGVGEMTLPPLIAEEARAFIAEIDHLLVRASVTITPAGGALAVDGRPLETLGADPLLLVAGTAPPGRGAPTPIPTFTVLLDPGNHLFTLSRKGYSDIVLNRTLTAGSTPPLHFELSRLPARLTIAADREAAAVSLDGIDVGTTPLSLERAPGGYRLLVRKNGFRPYETQFTLAAGDELNLRAQLPVEKRSLVTRWWFWTSVGAVATGAVIATYLLTVSPPPLDGGGLGWVVPIR